MGGTNQEADSECRMNGWDRLKRRTVNIVGTGMGGIGSKRLTVNIVGTDGMGSKRQTVKVVGTDGIGS